MSKTIKWGILGLGKIAKKFASDLLLANDAHLHSVASRDQARANEFARSFKAEKAYGSYEQLAADPSLDIIYIATPHVFHFENTMMCLKSGKSVLCEKPFAMNVDQVKIMVEEAKRRKLFLMEAMWTRFIPCTEELVRLLKQKVIGEVLSVHADFGFKAPKTSTRLFERSLGGGALLDVGIYPVYLALLALGVPSDIQAMARMTQEQIDSFCGMLFDYSGKQKAVLECSIESNTPTEGYIYGERGSIRIHSRFHHPVELTLSIDKEEDKLINTSYNGFGYYHEIVSVMDCLAKGAIENEKMPHEMSIQLISVLDTIRSRISLTYEQDAKTI